MRKIYTVLAGLGLAAALGTPAHAVEAIVVLADGCAGCHGTDGKSSGDIPSFAGKSALELRLILREFRAGTRGSTVMDRVIKGFTDEQLDAIVAHFTSLSTPKKK